MDVRTFKITNILEGSPIEMAEIPENVYLLGIYEFKFKSIDDIVQWCDYFKLQSLKIHLAIFNPVTLVISLHQVTLGSGWKGGGMFGCQFRTGFLNELKPLEGEWEYEA